MTVDRLYAIVARPNTCRPGRACSPVLVFELEPAGVLALDRGRLHL